MKSSTVRKVSVSQLAISPHNVRRAPPTAAERNELKASILVSGLLQNLVVHSKGQKGAETFFVACGGRRLDALQALVAEDRIKDTFEVPVRVVTEKEAAELSLAENVQRVAMHPADEFEAFAAIIEAGSTIEQVATRFGVSPRHVEKRLKLGRLAPALLDELRAGKLNLESCYALTLSDDHDRQLAAWEAAKKEGAHLYRGAEHAIRRVLTEDRISSDSQLGRAIAIEDYEAAGGAIVRDLFSESEDGETWFADPELVRSLVQAKLDAKAEALRTEWKWVEAAIDVEVHRAGWSRLHPVPIDPPVELVEELDRLMLHEQEIEACEEDDWTDEIGAELDALYERRDELRRAIDRFVAFTPEQMQASGCIVSIGHDGIRVAEGILSPDDIAAIQAANVERSEGLKRRAVEAYANAGAEPDAAEIEATSTAELPVAIPGQPLGLDRTAEANANCANEDEEDDRPAHSQNLTHYLDAHRHQILTAHIAGDFGSAFDLVLWDLCVGVLRGIDGYRRSYGVTNCHFRPAHVGCRDEDLRESPAARLMDAHRKQLTTGFLTLADEDEAFAAMCALPHEEKEALLAYCVAQTVEHHRRAPCEAVGTRLGVRVERFWRPTADSYWSKVRKDHCLAVARDVLDEQWAADHGGDKKGVLTKAMHTVFVEGRGISVAKDAIARAMAWLPEGMGFAELEGRSATDPERSEVSDSNAAGEEVAPGSASADVEADADSEAVDPITLPAFLGGEAA